MKNYIDPCLAMVAKTEITIFPFTINFGAAGTAGGHDCKCAVWSGTPSSVRICSEDSSQHQGFVEVQ